MLVYFATVAWAQNGPASTLRFSAQPTQNEISRARVFDEPLLPIGGTPTAQENKALAQALSAYAARANYDDLSAFDHFLERFPNSAWTGSLLLHLGIEYNNYGCYSGALDAWQQSWRLLKGTYERRGKPQADRALGELARMYSKLGRLSDLSNLLASVRARPLTGPGTQLIHFANQALWLMQNRPDICFRCGPMALDSILSENNPTNASNPVIVQSRSTTNGCSLAQVKELAQQLGLDYQMAFRSQDGPIIVPSVIHWKVGHYAAVVKRDGDRYLVRDHTFHRNLLMTATALNRESSGYFLIPAGPLPHGWRTVLGAEGSAVWGKGVVQTQDSGQTGPTALQVGGNKTQCSTGMTTYTMNTMLASLSLYDTPVGYKPPVGPAINFTLTYNQNDINQADTFSYSSLGPNWTCNWISYMSDEPNNPGNDVTCYAPGGGTLTFTGYTSSNQPFAPELMTQAVLRMTPNSGYEMQFPDGSRREYALATGTFNSVRLIFLTQMIDPAGNSVQLNYDADFRLTNIVDAIGQSTTFSYGNSSNQYLITQVTDPFGRSASFQYDDPGLLVQTTDVLGLYSRYTYSNDFVTTLTTPYGITHFGSGMTNGVSWLLATDPLGQSELMEAIPNLSPNAPSEPASQTPPSSSMTVYNQAMNYRNTFYWDKMAYEIAVGDYSGATLYHFLHTSDINVESGVLESMQRPFENMVWYDYAGQPQPYEIGLTSINRPTFVGRVLDDGNTQLRQYQYNALGKVTNSIDPLGRTYACVYATNNVDLLRVMMTSHGNSNLLSTMTYNSQHRPLTITDASGQTTTNTYNAQGQILSTTDPLGETTTFTYGTNGYLLFITNALQSSGGVTSFTYDSFGRIQTVTDTEGYTLTYAYDAMDRVTSITHPDTTSEQFTYSNLDLAASADRLGRWTTNTYDADRQLIATQDPLGRMTQYDYCACGALAAVFDPSGNTTWWDHDLESRVTAKFYADGSGVSYQYENTTSRLHQRTDEKGRQTIYQYYDDDNLESVSYPNAVVSTPTVSYTYDTNYNRIVSMLDGIGTTTYVYNPVTPVAAPGAGQLVSVSGPLPASVITYQYDALERVTNRAVNGVAEMTTFDVLGRATTVTNALGTFQYTYVDATPRLASATYPNGQTTQYSYYPTNGDERLMQIQNYYPNSTLISAHGYAYNAVGQITAWTNQWDTLPTRVWQPAYDADDELTNVVVTGGPGSVTNYEYGYDPAGNRILAGTNGVDTQYSYNTLNQLAGSSATLTNVSYQWDAENRLVAIIQGSNTSQFSYDGLGRRVQITELTNGVVMTNNYYLWCDAEICEMRDSTGAIQLRRFFSQGEALSSGVYYFYTRDHLGTVREALDTNGILETRYDYDPFGQQSPLQENVQTTFGFTGDLFHRKSGLYLTWFRPLDSARATWLSRDPMLRPTSQNPYLYGLDDPINYVDPLGLAPSPASMQRLLKYLASPRTQKNIQKFLFKERKVPKDLKDLKEMLDVLGAEDSGKEVGQEMAESRPCDAALETFLFVGELVAGETPVGLALELFSLGKDLQTIGSIVGDIESNNQKIAELQVNQDN